MQDVVGALSRCALDRLRYIFLVLTSLHLQLHT